MKLKLLFICLAFTFSSLSFSQVDLGLDREICEGTVVLLTASVSGTNVTHAWSLNGIIIPSATNAALFVNETGTYSVVVTADGISYSDSVNVTFYGQPLVYDAEAIICDDDISDGLANFDLSIYQITDNIFDNVSTFHLTQADADLGVNPLPLIYTNTVPNYQTLYTRVEVIAAGCYSTGFFYLEVQPITSANTPTPYEICGTGGVGNFNLDAKSAEISDVPFPFSTVSYYLTEQDAYNGQSALPSDYTNVSNPQTIYARVFNNGCFNSSSVTSLQLIVNDDDVPEANPIAPVSICGFPIDYDLTVHESEIIGAQTDVIVSYFSTSNDLINNTNIISNPSSFTIVNPGSYSYYVRVDSNNSNCYNYSEINITVNNPPQINTITLFECNNTGEATFDLASQIPNINLQSNVDITFYETFADANNATNPIVNADSYTNIQNPQGVHVRAENINTACYNIGVLELFVEDIPAIITPSALEVCDDDNDGFASFDLDSKTSEILGSLNSNDYIVSYYETQLDSEQETNALLSPYSNAINPQTIYVRVENNFTDQCYSLTTLDLVVLISPNAITPSPLTACDDNNDGIIEFDLLSKVDEITAGNSDFIVTFHATTADAENNTNALMSPSTTPGLVYARVESNNTGCFTIVTLQLVVQACPTIVDCTDIPVDIEYCYELNDTTQYNFESNDGSQLIVNFNAGQLEYAYDALIVIDSDGITNLNASSPYGNNGDLTGMVFVSSGSSISIYVDSDEIYSCSTENYTPINYEVSCFDALALPNCDAELLTPINGATDVEATVNFAWSAATQIVSGYRISIGTAPGGVDIADNIDVGNSLMYNPTVDLDFETTYYVTILPYNDNGDATSCVENSFTTGPDESQVDCSTPINIEYCYTNDDTTQFYYQSTDGSQLTVVFNAGEVEADYDPLVVLDSDGMTNLNTDTPYGTDGDISNLTFTSTGNSLTIYVNSDDIYSCEDEGYIPLNFNVFCSNSVGVIEVNAFSDSNSNMVFDSSETLFTNGYFTYEINNDGIIHTVESSTGTFIITEAEEANSYDIGFNFYDEYLNCFDVSIPSYQDITVANGNIVVYDFPVVEEQPCDDLAVYLIPITSPRPGFNFRNQLVIENNGITDIASGTIEFVLDSSVELDAVFSNPSSHVITSTSNGFTLDFANLQSGEESFVIIQLYCPTSLNLDDLITNTASYITNTNDIVPENDESVLTQTVIGSYDPNDKTESHGKDILYDDFITSDEYLYYTIRFQNVGTAEAIFIRIEDELDTMLDETSFQMLRSSHDYQVTRTGTSLEWFFDDINLPAEQDNAEGSNGYVYFKIKPKSGYAIGDIIPNSAAIFFDFNLPIITNTFATTFVETLSVDSFDDLSFQIYPNPAKELVNIRLNSNVYDNTTLSVYDVQGKQVLELLNFQNNETQLDVSELQSGLYFIELSNKGNYKQIEKLVIE